MKTQFPASTRNPLFDRMSKSKSRSTIWAQAEAALPHATGSDVQTLQNLINANDLDEMYLILAEACGRDDEATRLREWMTPQLAYKLTSSCLKIGTQNSGSAPETAWF